MPCSVRISLTAHVPADEDTHQILYDASLAPWGVACHQHAVHSASDVEDRLYGVMEAHDSVDSFSVFVDSLEETMRFVYFLRDQNPRKEIRLYFVNQELEGPVFSPEGLGSRGAGVLGECDVESLFDAVSSLTFVRKSPGEAVL